MKFGNIDKAILFGGSRILSDFAQHILEEGTKVIVFSSKRHLEEAVGKGGETLRDLLKNTEISYFDCDDINTNSFLKKTATQDTLGVAFGAAWVFHERTVQFFKKNYLLDFMAIDLPRYRGGAHCTWQILHRNRRGCVNLQIIHGGKGLYQTGEILKRLEYNFPLRFKTPQDYLDFIAKKGYDFLVEFWAELQRGENFRLHALYEEKSSYYPFLSAKMNGLIDWSWQGKDVFSFITAFDNPYAGASTWWRGTRVFLKDAAILAEEENYHPFTSGVVVRKGNEHICIATNGNLLRIGSIRDEKEKDKMNAIELGDRFVTPQDKFEQALCFKPVYNSKGIIIQKY